MGKQINFYIGSETQEQFIRYLSEQGFVFLESGLLKRNHFIPLDKVIQESQVYLYKDIFGDYTITTIRNTGQSTILSSHNPVIEYSLSKISIPEKRVYAGRLWLTSEDFFDNKTDRSIVMTEYTKLTRWIKKNLLYQVVNTSSKKYIDRETLDLVVAQKFTLY